MTNMRTRVFRGDRLKERRLAHGLTQEELNKMLEFGKGNPVNRYENGKSDPTADVLARLSRVLHVSTDYLLGLVDEPDTRVQDQEFSASERALIRAMRLETVPVRQVFELFLEILDDIDDQQAQKSKKTPYSRGWKTSTVAASNSEAALLRMLGVIDKAHEQMKENETVGVKE